MAIEFDGGSFNVPPEIVETIQKGAAYRELSKSDGYRRLLDFLEKRSDMALAALRDAPYAEDRIKLSLQMVWQQREEMLKDLQLEVERGVLDGRTLADELDRNTAMSMDMPIDFGNYGE